MYLVTITNNSCEKTIVVISETTKAELRPNDSLTITETTTIMITEKK